MTKKEMLKEKPLGELKALRQRIAELEAIVAAYNSDEKSNEFDDVQKYRAVFESTTDVVLVIDKKGKITDVNKRLKEISGYEQEALIGKNITALAGMMTEKSFAQVSSNFLKRVFGVNMPPYEVEMIKKNRASIIVEISAQPLKKNDKIIGDLVILRDVTERKQVEESLKASEEKYSTIIEQSTDGIIILNNRLVEFANHKMCEMSGYSQIEILGRNFHELVAPEYEELLIEKQQEGLSKQIVSEHDEMELITKGGKKIPVESKLISIVYKGNPAGMAIIRDITEEKIAEEALKKSEESFRNTLDNSPMGIRISDKQDDTLYVNQAFLNMFDYENTEELRASPPLKHYTPESYADFLLRMEKQRGGKPRPDSVEIDIVRKDGTIRNLWLSTRELIWYGKQQFQNLYIDITNKKTAEEAVKESETRYHELVNTISSGVFIYKAFDNGADFVFVDINSAVEKMEGINRKDIIGKRVTEVLPNVKDYYWFSVFQRVWQTGDSEYFASGERQDERETGRWRDNWVYKLPNGEIMNIYDDITERKRAELALKASEENFRNSMDDTLLGVRISDIDNRTLYANQALLDIFGYKNIDEVRAKSPQEYYSPESYADYLTMKEKLSRGETMPTQAEIDIVRKDGDVRHLQALFKEISWNSKLQYQTLYNDITERKMAEEALRESEEKYRLIVENSQDIIFTLDSAGKFIYTSPSIKQMLGYNQTDLIGLPFISLVHPEDRHVIEDAIRLGDEAGNQTTGGNQYRFRHASGEWRWHISRGTHMLDTGGKSFNFIGIANDITERKQAEEKLKQAAQEWRTTFDSITDLISIHDKENRIIRVNKAVADMLKTTPNELIGKYCHEVMHGTKEPPANCPHLQTLKTGKPAAIETLNPNLQVYFHESSSPLFNEKGEVTGSIIIARDVTQQKRIEEQLIMTDRLASISELSSGIAHELNNPLTSVIGFSQLLMEGDVPENIKADLSTVYSEAQRAAVIVKNLLTFARKHAPVKQLCQVNSIIEDVLRLRTYEQKVNNIEVEKRLASNLPGIMIDYFQMQQVFLNIIVNAEFAMLEEHHRGRLIITTEAVDGFVRVSFADDGPGISEENLKHIFDPFFTTKEVGKGTGLGLSICHGVVTEHGGKIYARSELGHGATFVVDLPLIRQYD